MDIFQILPIMRLHPWILSLQGKTLLEALMDSILRLQLKIIIVLHSCAKLNIIKKFFYFFNTCF